MISASTKAQLKKIAPWAAAAGAAYYLLPSFKAVGENLKTQIGNIGATGKVTGSDSPSPIIVNGPYNNYPTPAAPGGGDAPAPTPTPTPAPASEINGYATTSNGMQNGIRGANGLYYDAGVDSNNVKSLASAIGVST